ncbi:hypothetical protein FHT44_004945 [Mycolicibacterium sp. BK634]|nr:hypothetical protein [Mycolicibacterium sp. BK634]MBB3752433.1 hypothetical protein [Mycolicibacterium sp. BK634]
MTGRVCPACERIAYSFVGEICEDCEAAWDYDDYRSDEYDEY